MCAVVCGAVAAGLSFLLPETWESQATLIIIPPKIEAAVEPNALSPITYQNLLESKEMAQEILQKLKIKDVQIEQLQRNLKTSTVVEERGLNQRSYSPIVKLSARAKTPQLAAKIANTWADLFVKRNTLLTSEGSEMSYEFLTTQYDVTNTQLLKAEEDLKKFRNDTQLELIKTEIGTYISKLESFRGTIKDLQYDLDTKRRRLERLQAAIQAEEMDGKWIGLITPDRSYSDFLKQKSMYNAQQADPTALYFRAQTLEAKSNLIYAQEKLRIFLETNKLVQLKDELETSRKDFINTKVEYTKNNITVMSLETTLLIVKSNLEKTPKTISLSKGLSSEALWNLAISGKTTNQQQLNDLAIKTEEQNPEYLALQQKYIDLQAQYDTLKPRQDTLKSKMNELDDTVRSLDTLVESLNIQKNRLESQATLALTAYNQVSQRYANAKAEVNSLEVEVDQLKSRLNETVNAANTLSGTVQSLQSNIYNGEMSSDQKNRLVQTIRSTFDMLSKEVEKAKLAKSSQISEIRIAAKAVPPQQRVSPKRSLITLTAIIAGLIIGLMFALFQEFLFPKEKTEGI